MQIAYSKSKIVKMAQSVKSDTMDQSQEYMRKVASGVPSDIYMARDNISLWIIL